MDLFSLEVLVYVVFMANGPSFNIARVKLYSVEKETPK